MSSTQSTIQRTVLYEAGGEDCGFTVERWFIVLPDDPRESVSRIALVWHGEDKESVVIIGPTQVMEIVTAMVK